MKMDIFRHADGTGHIHINGRDVGYTSLPGPVIELPEDRKDFLAVTVTFYPDELAIHQDI